MIPVQDAAGSADADVGKSKLASVIFQLFALMTYQILISLLFFGFTTRAQPDTALYNKVSEMMDLSGATDNVRAILREFRNDADLKVHEDFWGKYIKEIEKDGLKRLKERIIPIYVRYLTEEDIDGIIDFYKSKPGQSLRLKQNEITVSAMRAGEELRKEFATEVLENLLKADEEKFSAEVEGCNLFYQGEFMYYLSDETPVYVALSLQQPLPQYGV